MSKSEQERLGISDETLKSMKEFFLRTSIPRILEKRKKGEKNVS